MAISSSVEETLHLHVLHRIRGCRHRVNRGRHRGVDVKDRQRARTVAIVDYIETIVPPAALSNFSHGFTAAASGVLAPMDSSALGV
jgi:hypothetical protein